MKMTVKPFLVLALMVSCGCSLNGLKGFDSVISAPPPDSSVAPTFEKTLLLDDSYVAGGVTNFYHLYKTQWGSQAPQFMQWIPNPANQTAGAVILFYPYEGISWTGLTSEIKWNARTAGPYADEDGPSYQAGVSSDITYTPLQHLDAAQSASVSALKSNGLHVLIVYGRYYAGSTPTQDIEAVVNAYRFLDQQTLVDKTNIGIYSGSWGGIGVLYGSAISQLKPKAISLAFPVSSPKDLYSYIDSIPSKTSNPTVQNAYQTFFDPYRRRINKATESLAGQPTRYDSLSHPQLASLSADLFIIHDEYDTLVPLAHSLNLMSTVASTEKTIYIQRHDSAIDYDTFVPNHSQAAQPIDYGTHLTWTMGFLIAELAPATQIRPVIFQRTVLVAQFQHMKSMYDIGQDTTAFRKVLALYCKPNIVFVNLEATQPEIDAGTNRYPGSTILAFLMSNYYEGGWAADGPSACAKLQSQPPF